MRIYKKNMMQGHIRNRLEYKAEWLEQIKLENSEMKIVVATSLYEKHHSNKQKTHKKENRVVRKGL